MRRRPVRLPLVHALAGLAAQFGRRLGLFQKLSNITSAFPPLAALQRAALGPADCASLGPRPIRACACAQCGDADDAQCLTTVERTSAGLPSGTAPPAAALPVGSAPAPPRLHALLAGSDATTSPHALSNTAIGLIAGVCMLALLVAGAQLLLSLIPEVQAWQRCGACLVLLVLSCSRSMAQLRCWVL